jgi:hypothetical protein
VSTERGRATPRPAVKPHVKSHLEKNNVDNKDLPDGVVEALNFCTADELQAMDKVGASMEDAKMDLQLPAFAFH